MPDNAAPRPPFEKRPQKQAKAERFAANKLERRAREKEARKEKKRLHALKRAAGELDDDDKRASKKPRVVTDFKGKVVLDLGFDDKMNEKRIPIAQTVMQCIRSPSFLVINGRTFARLESLNDAGYKRWTNTQWWQEGYEKLWGDGVTERGNVVYLTADADYELLELKEDETYIIGGICDHNRYKNLCLNKAKESGVRAARLPIGRYLAQMPTRKVLTVNQVMEILIKWAETKDWEQALYAVVPKRKFRTNEPEAEEDDGKEGHEGDDDGKHPLIADTEVEPPIEKAVD
ncbi:tRNA (guanine(9)-N(1))-methyltransferase [Salix suchowensis]|nr:tRNA (guanine(9)-N(1))-methyltransferase [Salix suchowensis]